MIEFKFVRWKNFVSYGDALTEVRFDSNKATLVIGDNGAGKSTMIDALCYGTDYQLHRARLDRYVDCFAQIMCCSVVVEHIE